MYKIMFVDDEEHVRAMLLAYFGEIFNAVAVEGAAQALEALEKEPFDLIISDINMPGLSGTDFLLEVRKRYPGTKTAFLTSMNIDEYLAFANEIGMSSIIPKTIPFNFTEVEDIITGLLTGEIFGLERYMLRDTPLDSETFCITSSAEARTIREAIVTRITDKGMNARDTNLILDEILTNAIYHAPTRADGEEKYRQFSDVELEQNEYIYAEFGCDAEKYAVSITDPHGALTRGTVLNKMIRQITGEGLMDDSGRGLHMCRLFADRLIINIERGKRTEVIIMNYLSGNYRGHKPLYINEI